MEVVADGLDSPTAVAVSADGGVYVSEEFAGRVLRVEGAPPGGLDSRYPLVGAALGAAGAVVAARVGLCQSNRRRTQDVVG